MKIKAATLELSRDEMYSLLLVLDHVARQPKEISDISDILRELVGEVDVDDYDRITVNKEGLVFNKGLS